MPEARSLFRSDAEQLCPKETHCAPLMHILHQNCTIKKNFRHTYKPAALGLACDIQSDVTE